MQKIKDAAAEFLANKRVAVTGVSRNPGDHGRQHRVPPPPGPWLRGRRGQPERRRGRGDTCYHDLKSIPGGVDAVVIATHPETAEATMRECAELDINHVWMHRAFGAGSLSPAAADYGRAHGISVIDGGCPLMFPPAADVGHRVMRVMLTLKGNVPKTV